MTGTQRGGSGSADSKSHQGLSGTNALEGGTYQEVKVEDCRVVYLSALSIRSVRMEERTPRLATSPNVSNLREGCVRRWRGKRLSIAASPHRQTRADSRKTSKRSCLSTDTDPRFSPHHGTKSRSMTHFRCCANNRANRSRLKPVTTTRRNQRYVQALGALDQCFYGIHPSWPVVAV